MRSSSKSYRIFQARRSPAITAGNAIAKLRLLHRGMQDCFRQHPDIYGAELSDDPEDEDEVFDAEPQPAGVVATAPYSGSETVQKQVPDANLTATPSSSPITLSSAPSIHEKAASVRDQDSAPSGSKMQARTQRAKSAKKQVENNYGLQQDGDKEGEAILPRAAHDAREQSTEQLTGKQ